MKKRLMAVLLAAACSLLAPALTASADVLIEPNNNFYADHSSECEYLARRFYANGEGGEIRLVEEPGSKSEVARVKNGDIITILFTYDDNGKIWGVTEIYEAGTSYYEWPNGWVPMDKLLLVYDYLTFEEDHGDELYNYNGNYDTLKSAAEVVLWSWPGSGETQGTIDSLDDEGFSISQAYKDADGREWGFISYWQGYRNTWICLSDPANDSIPAFNPPPDPELWQSGDVDSDTPLNADDIPATGQRPLETVITVVLIAFLIVATVVIIRIHWKHGRKS